MGGYGKFGGNIKQMITGEPKQAALGLHYLLGVREAEPFNLSGRSSCATAPQTTGGASSTSSPLRLARRTGSGQTARAERDRSKLESMTHP